MGMNQIRETIAEVFEDVANALETGSFGRRIRVGLTILAVSMVRKIDSGSRTC